MTLKNVVFIVEKNRKNSSESYIVLKIVLVAMVGQQRNVFYQSIEIGAGIRITIIYILYSGCGSTQYSTTLSFNKLIIF